MPGAVEIAILRDRPVANKRRSSKRRQVDVELDVSDDAQVTGHVARGRHFTLRAPARSEPSTRTVVPIAPRHRARRIRVQPAAEKKNCFHFLVCVGAPPPAPASARHRLAPVYRNTFITAPATRRSPRHSRLARPQALRLFYTPRVVASQMYLCAWSCSRTGRRSARIHAARSFAGSTP